MIENRALLINVGESIHMRLSQEDSDALMEWLRTHTDFGCNLPLTDAMLLIHIGVEQSIN